MTDKKKAFNETKSDIERCDECTFYVKSSKDPNKEYMIYKDLDDRWLCECMDFIVHLPDQGKPVDHKCKHILRCMLL